MTPAQIAGLAIAAGAAFIIAIGLMALSIFLRRRRERRNSAETNEKGSLSPGLSDYSPRYSQVFVQGSSAPDPPSRFLLPPAPVQRKPDQYPRNHMSRNAGLKPLMLSTARDVNASTVQLGAASNTDLSSIHPLLRPVQGASNNASNSSVPLEQIGLAISIEPPTTSITHSGQNVPPQLEEVKQQQRPTIARRNADISLRPDSVMTQTTLFEEDEIRRESKLLPTPPVPIPPIRTFQPSRPPPAANLSQATMTRTNNRQLPQQPELFLDIPVRYSRSHPSKVETLEATSHGKSASASALKTQLPPRTRTSEYNPMSADSELSHGGDIPDYYFTAYEEPRPIHSVSSGNPSRRFRPKQEQVFGNVKPKRSSSNVSRATSRASTNIRDSFSSQTSFETIDPNDPTPEDDDGDRRLDDGKLSPVVESPISKLRYPKVPRTSNQLVPRSPKSPQSQASQSSPRWQPQPSSLLVKRKGEQGALTLGSPFRSGSPDMPTEEMQALKSPVWVPRLTPTRQGDDLFINVTYSKPGH
ncbi:hypothetical protein N0V90_010658 [Kalmusia sp. IMI 367209]|nr:hypothetical protein N0V90_010658 [Kalmusia sp. IMI 367209]